MNYKILCDAAPLGIFVYSKDGQVLGANQFLLNMLGSPSLEATKQISLFAFENLKGSGISDFLARALEHETPRQMETSYTSKWGKTSFVDIIAVPLSEDNSVPEKAIAFVQDITGHKKTRDHLLKSEMRFQLLAERTPLGIAIVDYKGLFEYINPMFATLFGCSVKETPTLQACLDMVIPDVASRNMVVGLSRGYRDLEVGDADQQHVAVRCRDGSSRNVRFRAFPLDEEKRVLICEDNSELVRALAARRASEEKYIGLLENLTDVVYCLDIDGTLLSVNRSAARLLGYEPGEVIGRNIAEVIPESARKHVPGNLQKVLQEGVAQGISQYRGKDGSIFYLEYSSTLIHPDEQPAYVVGVARDVTDRIVTKRALKESEAKFKLLVESAHDGIAYVDASGYVQFCNPRMKEILGDPAPEGKNLREYYDEENRRILEDHLAVRPKGESTTYLVTLTDLEGNPHKMVVSGTPYLDGKGNYIGAIGVYTDVSELKKLEAQLQQSQKMEAIGTLAGGIAHDFNNILSGVLGYASLLKKHALPESQLAHYAEMIEKSAERGATLAGQLLAFSRKGKRFIQTVDVHQLIDDVVEILQRTLDRKISVRCRKEAHSSAVEGDPGQIQQVLMNLCINAKDAMPEGGRLLLTTKTVELGEAFCRGHDGLLPGVFLEINVEDNGEGMSEDVKSRLFEPFFTTKEDGKGTGLGLAMVYGTVKGHGGVVKVYSEVGRGSVFKVLLPLKKDCSQISVSALEKKTAMGTGTVLVVDDEDIIRELLGEMLEELGFTVISARDGIEGLEIYCKQWQQIDVVIVDMIMPGLSGREAFREMKKINPSVRVILSTGFTREGAVQETLEEGIAWFVQKPYRLEELSEAMFHALSREGA
ncbi:MAG: PAS domain S-box protein [Desulfomonilaceae bacterium]